MKKLFFWRNVSKYTTYGFISFIMYLQVLVEDSEKYHYLIMGIGTTLLITFIISEIMKYRLKKELEL